MVGCLQLELLAVLIDDISDIGILLFDENAHSFNKLNTQAHGQWYTQLQWQLAP